MPYYLQSIQASGCLYSVLVVTGKILQPAKTCSSKATHTINRVYTHAMQCLNTCLNALHLTLLLTVAHCLAMPLGLGSCQGTVLAWQLNPSTRGIFLPVLATNTTKYAPLSAMGHPLQAAAALPGLHCSSYWVPKVQAISLTQHARLL